MSLYVFYPFEPGTQNLADPLLSLWHRDSGHAVVVIVSFLTVLEHGGICCCPTGCKTQNLNVSVAVSLLQARDSEIVCFAAFTCNRPQAQYMVDLLVLPLQATTQNVVVAIDVPLDGRLRTWMYRLSYFCWTETQNKECLLKAYLYPFPMRRRRCSLAFFPFLCCDWLLASVPSPIPCGTYLFKSHS